MATINATLTTEQFIKVFGDNEHVRDFSPEAVDFILGHVSDSQHSKVCDAEWKDFFIDAAEVTSENLVNDYIHEYKDRPEALLELVNYIDDASDELVNKINDNTELSASELLESVRAELEACNDWIRAAANLIADDKGWHELKGGGFVAIV